MKNGREALRENQLQIATGQGKIPETVAVSGISGCGGEDLNLRPPGYEPDELPTALPRDMRLSAASGTAPEVMVATRVMSPTSYQLLYPAIFICDAYLPYHTLRHLSTPCSYFFICGYAR